MEHGATGRHWILVWGLSLALVVAGCCSGGGTCGGMACPSHCSCIPSRIIPGARDTCSCPAGPPVDAGPLPDAPPPDAPPPDAPPPGTCFDSGVEPVDAGTPSPGAYVIPFAPEPGGGTPIVLGDDELSAPIPLGFTFRFFDVAHTEVIVGSNGFLTFEPSWWPGIEHGPAIPSFDRNNDVIAYAWTDLFPPGGGSITAETRGEAPSRRFVLTVTDQAWCCTGPPRVTAQVILYEGSGYVEIHTTSLAAGNRYTQGVENASGCTAYFLPGRVGEDFALTDDAVRFVTY